MLREVVVSGRRNPLHYGLAKRLKAAREDANIMQSRLSLDAGLSVDAVLRIEDNGRVPLLDTIERLARVLKISPCILAYGVQAPFIEGGDLQCASMGARLRQVREAQGLGLRALARAAGVTPTTIGYIETGRTVPSVATAEKISKALKIDPCWAGYGQGQVPDLPTTT